MNYGFLIRVKVYLLTIVAAFMLIPLGIALYDHDGASAHAFALTAGTIFLLFLLVLAADKIHALRNPSAGGAHKMTRREGYFLVAGAWILMALVGAFPFYLSGGIPRFAAAYFEAMSGFTTTGASILRNIEALPRALLFWRSLTHWIGGMGIVVLTVALLPLLGVGGQQLLQAESPGPTVGKLTPRITETAKILWALYLGMTVLQTLLLLLGGMSLFDALIHTFGTLATGGFSSQNSSIAAYSPYIHWVIIIFMVIAGMNFSLYYKILSGQGSIIFRDTETKTYLGILLLATLLVTLNIHSRIYAGWEESLRTAAFQVSSLMTTTGYATADYETWPGPAKFILFTLMLIGGCSGSTAGGIKVIRFSIILKDALKNMRKFFDFRHVFFVKIDGKNIPNSLIGSITAFIFLYAGLVLITAFAVATAGADILTALSTALATVGNIGPGFGLIGPTDNYAHYPAYIKWFLSFSMVAGRLEIYTLLVIFTPSFWKR